MATSFPVNPQRRDPYKNFKFRVMWEGRYVAGANKVSGLVRTTEVITFREGGDPNTPRLSPGQTQFGPITIERGLTQDTEFEIWASQVWNFGAGLGREVSLKTFRRNISIEVYNEAGQLVLSYNVFRAWPSEYRAFADLDASANGVAIQSLILQNEGWERDAQVAEPEEPSYGG